MSSSSNSKIASIQDVIDKTYTPAPHTSTSGITDQNKNLLVSKQRLQSAISLGLYAYIQDSSNKIDVTITYKNKTITVANNNTQVCSFTYDKAIDDLKFTLGCAYYEKGNPMRYAIATVYQFSIDKTS